MMVYGAPLWLSTGLLVIYYFSAACATFSGGVRPGGAISSPDDVDTEQRRSSDSAENSAEDLRADCSRRQRAGCVVFHTLRTVS